MAENVVVPSEILSESSLENLNFFGGNYSFKEQDFRDAVSEIGVSNIASGLVGIAQENNATAEGLFSLESLRDGTSVLQGLLPGNIGLTPKDKKWDDLDIITYFSNVNDFGGGTDAKTKAFINRLQRSAAPAGALTVGGIAGARLAARIPSLLLGAAKTFGGPYVKFGAGFLGLIGGSILGETGARKLQNRIFGEVDPVTPELQKYAQAGDILPYGVSVVASPYMLPKKMGLGAVKWLDDFRGVSSSGNLRLPGPLGTSLNDKNLIAAAKDAGLSTKNYLRAAMNRQKPQGSKTLKDIITPDPAKGPLTMRGLAAFERGLVTSGQAGRGELGALALGASLGVDAISAGGASLGGFAAEKLAPNELGYRVFGEVTGAGAPGLAAIGALKTAQFLPNIFGSVKNLVKKYVLRSPGVVNEAIKSDALKRVYAVLESSTELSSPEELNRFITDLGSMEIPKGFYELDDAGNAVLDATGNPVKLKLTASNIAAARNLPLQKTLALIEKELSRAGDELSIQSKKGRANFIQGSKSMIMLLRKTGNPESFKLAAEIEQNLYTQNITDNLQASINKLFLASEALTKPDLEKIPFGPTIGENPYAVQSSEIDSVGLGEKLNAIVRKQLENSRARRNSLWDAVGNEEITTFFTKDGTELAKPNLLTFLDEIDFSGSKSAKANFKRNLDTLTLDIDAIRKMFRTGGAAEEITSNPNLGKILGTGGEDYVLDSLPGGARFQAERFKLAERGTPFSGDAEQERLISIRLLREAADRVDSADLKGLSSTEALQSFGVNSGGLSTVRKMGTIFNEEADKLAAIPSETAGEVGTLTVGLLDKMRSIAGDTAAKLRKDGQISAANTMEGFRASINRDMMGDETLRTPVIQNLVTARAYTAAEYVAFGTKTFPGRINSKNGGTMTYTMGPRATTDAYFKGGANPNLLRTEEILSAGQFLVDNGAADASLLRGNTTAVMEALLRDVQRNIIDEKTINVGGKDTQVFEVNQTKLTAWKDKDSNKRLLAIFPGIEKDLKTLDSAQNLFDTLGSDLKALQQTDIMKAFNAVSGAENPSYAVSKALSSTTPTEALLELVRFANTNQKITNEAGDVFTNKQAREGLMNGIVDQAVQNSGGTGLGFNPQSFFDFMFTARPRGDLKKDLILSDFMVKNGLMNSDQLKSMRQATKEMINVDDALATGDLESLLFKNPTGMKMLQVKMLGATLGGVAQKRLSSLLKKVGFSGGGGGTLVAASEGSKQLQNILLIGPESIRQKYMVELLSDGNELSRQLLKLTTSNQKAAAERSIEKFFVNIGINTALKRGYLAGRDRKENRLDFLDSISLPLEGGRNEEVGPSSSVVLPNQEELRTSFLTRQLEQQPQSGNPPTNNFASSASGSGNAGTGFKQMSQEQKYAALFPNDASGIGSLMS